MLGAFQSFVVVGQESPSSEAGRLCVVETQDIRLADNYTEPVLVAVEVGPVRQQLLPLDYDQTRPFVDYDENIVALVSADEVHFVETKTSLKNISNDSYLTRF